MYSYPLTLDSTAHLGSGLSKDFDLIEVQDSASTSSVAADVTTSPRTLRISHSEVKRSGVTYARRLVRLDLQETDSVMGAVTCSAYLVLEFPGTEQTSITDGDAQNLVGQVIDFLTNTGNWAKFQNGEP